MKNESQSVTVAIVDDHEQLRNGIADMLEEMGIKVVCRPEHGEDALAQFSKLPRLPDVCLLDNRMPVMNGVETAKAMSKQFPDVKILGHSSDSDEFTVCGLLHAGADGFITKGSSPLDLVDAIQKMKEKGYWLDKAAVKALLWHLRKNGL